MVNRLGHCLAIATCLALFMAGESTSEDLERVLLPLTIDVSSGAFDSVWVSGVWAYNECDSNVTFGHLPIAGFFLAPDHSVQLPLFLKPANSPGQFLYLEANKAACVTFEHRVADLSRSKDSAGTAVPVVRQHEMKSGTIALMAVPVADTASRTMLRVYSTDCGAITVNFRPHDSLESVGHTYQLACGTSVYTPSYIAIRLDNAIEGIEESSTMFDILVRPVGEQRIWAFASVTNNDTQVFTIIAPQ